MATFLCLLFSVAAPAAAVDPGFVDPPREFSVMPFWFWNDDLQDAEIVRQIADFEAHGVYGFVIHPRIGLPADIGWLSPRMIHAMHVAVDEAARRGMYVVLYDEGMYPSGSSSGQVVARDPAHAARGLAKIDLAPGQSPQLEPGWNLVAACDRPGGKRLAVIERPSQGVIRGLHYQGEGTGRLKEDTPPAGDILNPAAVESFVDLVYDRFAAEFGRHFGKTVLGVFTDEPAPMGRGSLPGMVPGNARLLAELEPILGYDFRPHLADLWYEDHPESRRRRAEYLRAVHVALEERYYRRLSRWCAEHGTALTGHPGGSMDLGAERYFQIPGQDLVWRYVEPGKKAIEGEHSTMAKCASSAMIHLGRRRNANELYGAYGHNLTFAEMEWLANWCFVRGQNLLYPHAFYYSIRGPRRDERPPDVGPNAAWWPQYKPFADACRRLSWINTDARHVCDVAILADANYCPDAAAKACYQQQRDFNYIELRHLVEDARTDAEGVRLAGMHYRAVILDGLAAVPAAIRPVLARLARAGRLIAWGRPQAAEGLGGTVAVTGPVELAAALDRLTAADVKFLPASASVRYRHTVKNGRHYYLLFNEEAEPVAARLEVAARGAMQWLDPATGTARPAVLEKEIAFRGHELRVLAVGGENRSVPNIVVVLADDLGYGDVQSYNPQRGKVPTPNIDRLAAEGMRFTDGHSSSGVCSPSRYTLLTGRYHWRTRLQAGIVGVFGDPLIAPDRLTIAALAKQHGYRTACIGKWHLGRDWGIPRDQRALFEVGRGLPAASEPHRAAWREVFSKPIAAGPTSRGFDEYFGTDVPNWPPYCFIENDRTVGIPSELLPTALLTDHLASLPGPALADWKLEPILPALGDRACEFIARQAKAKQPFLLYMPLTSPHTPLAVNDAWKGKSGLGLAYPDFVMETDAVVGRVLDAIAASGIAGNTLVVFTSDNGCAPYIGAKALEAQGHFPSGPLRGYKGDVWEGGHRVPFVVRWPGVVKPGSVCGQLVHQADVMATLADVLGVKLPDSAGEDSFSLVSLLKGADKPVREHAVSCASSGVAGLRKGVWKLVFQREPKAKTDLQLYNLAEDLAETRNLAADKPAVVAEMGALMAKLIAEGRSTPGAKQRNDVEVTIHKRPAAPGKKSPRAKK